MLTQTAEHKPAPLCQVNEKWDFVLQGQLVSNSNFRLQNLFRTDVFKNQLPVQAKIILKNPIFSLGLPPKFVSFVLALLDYTGWV
jgi:hypothetical protein